MITKMFFSKKIYLLYNDEYLLIKNLKKISRNKNFFVYEVYTPYPIHGIEKILKLKNSNLSFLSFIYGIFGFLFSNLLIWYTMIFDWPQNIGGKPSFSWIRNLPSFIPIIFELIIFFSAHLMCITYLTQCKLFPGSKAKNPYPQTTDSFFSIKVYIKKYSNDIDKIFKKNGAVKIIIKDYK